MLREMVECESPSDSPADVNRFQDLVASQVSGIGRVRLVPCGSKFGKAMLCEFSLPGPKRKQGPSILGVGHADTVWPLGTLRGMPFREADGRLWGPGVLDMKAGLAFFIWAVKALRELDLPVSRPVRMWVVPDEEVGSEGSRALTEQHAKDSHAVLVLEPGTGLTGKLKTARKGVGDFTVRVKGRASHAGVDFSAGASAVVELSKQVVEIAGFTNLSLGITVNPGVIAGGTRTNVVAESAECEVDMRIARLRDAAPLERKFRALRAFDKRCTIEVTGGLNRPPMERTKGVAALYKAAEKLAENHLGLKIEESSTGGGSDGNFTAALGVPTLDGIGAVGEGAHAANESILTDRIPDRVALLALLVHHLGQ
jgi:glutamate carboxypeptidase